MYAAWGDTIDETSVMTKEQITGIDITEYHVYQASMNADNKTITYTIDGIEKKVMAYDITTTDCEVYHMFSIERTEAVNKSLFCRFLISQFDR